MTHRLATNYAKNYCNRTIIVKVIVENVVIFFGGGHSVLEDFCYLDSNISRLGNCDKECKMRIGKVSSVFERLANIWKRQHKPASKDQVVISTVPSYGHFQSYR